MANRAGIWCSVIRDRLRRGSQAVVRAAGLHVRDTFSYVKTFCIHLLMYVCIDFKDNHAKLDTILEPFALEFCRLPRDEPYVEVGQICLQRYMLL